MDIKNGEWFAQIAVSGVAKPILLKGSIISLLGSAARELSGIQPRTTVGSNGKEIIIRISDTAVSDSKESTEFERLTGIVAGLSLESEPENPTPLEGESYSEFVDRLEEQYGFDLTTSTFIANDWFGLKPDSRLVNWTCDPRARRFRYINASSAAFESASPDEYKTLFQYCSDNYSDFVSNMSLRIAP